MQENFFTTDVCETPFLSLIKDNAPSGVCYSDIIKVLNQFKKIQKLQENNSDHIDPRLIHLNRHIRKNYNSSITLQDLADLFGVHPTYLSNTFSKVFKISPILFVNQLRMKAAKELLMQPDLTLKYIAEKVGYTSLSQFSLIFKRFHSKTPSQYREDIIKGTTKK